MRSLFIICLQRASSDAAVATRHPVDTLLAGTDIMNIMSKFMFSRRQFLTSASVAGTAALTGCSDGARKLIPHVIPPPDIVPGEATWYATTCRECPAGCGLLAKNRDGHVIKVEGNPRHPINTGKVCPRGQASVQGIYNPDRYRQPLVRDSRGKLRATTWQKAEQMLLQRLSPLIQGGRKRRVVFLTGLVTGSRRDLIERWISALGGEHLMYEPIAYEALRKGNQSVFGRAMIPSYHIDRADFLLSLGANFLEYWVSNVQFTRQFATFHEPKQGGGKNIFVYVGPRLSMTAANADYWMTVPVGTESLVAGALLNAIGKGTQGQSGQEVTPDVLYRRTGVPPERLNFVAQQLGRARSPLILAEGTGYHQPNALETVVAANLLQFATGSTGTIDWQDPVSLGDVAYASQMRDLAGRMIDGEIDALIIDGANPVFHLPASWEFERRIAKVPFVVSFSSYPDETGSLAHLVMPTRTFLETWGDYSPRVSVHGMLQPVMGPLFSTKQLEDILLSSGKKLTEKEEFPEKDSYDVVRTFWSTGGKGRAAAGPESTWQQDVERGGVWAEGQGSRVQGFEGSRQKDSGGQVAKPPGAQQAGAPLTAHGSPFTGLRLSKTFAFITYPTIQFFDGRLANRPFLQEMPDPVTMIPWEGWIEVNPRMAEWLGVEQGDIITLRSANGAINGPVYVYPGLADYTVATPFGRGHGPSFGRYVTIDKVGNPVQLISSQPDPAGGLVWATYPVSVSKAGASVSLARADASGFQHGRHLARDITVNDLVSSAGQEPDVVMPLFEGWRKEIDFYPKHYHDEHRWGMAVDLDRCIGCQACVIACYAENNVGIVGKENFRKGREMSWIHIERYFERDQPFMRFLPVLCRHCGEAPDGSVCSVFAPNHSIEGINNQFCNRSVGTRFCNQNCPWKVRRFNWFTWRNDEPLGWQINPDVTVRQKGVMEKCSFCIQRMSHARTKAISENRLIRDGEFEPACAQTCPADVFVFGNLKDPNSRVSQLIRQARAYQLLGELNTKPVVVYLKKVVQRTV